MPGPAVWTSGSGSIDASAMVNVTETDAASYYSEETDTCED